MTSFSIVERSFAPNRGETDHVFLEMDSWDDYTFRTLFHASYSTSAGDLVRLGTLKIIKKGMTGGEVDVPSRFTSLNDSYCSLGQEQSYYETIRQLPEGIGFRILRLLRDVVVSPEILATFEKEKPFQTSALRSINLKTLDRFRLLLLGQHQRAGFNFIYFSGDDPAATPFPFVVKPQSLPSTNVHALIGRNGVGKTTLLARMAEAVCLNANARRFRPEVGQFLHVSDDELDATGSFTNVVGISFSAFDHFRVPTGDGKEELDTRYDYIGLRSLKHQRLKDLTELASDFYNSAEVCIRSSRSPFWLKAIETLSSDPGFDYLQLHKLADLHDKDFELSCKELYLSASAGHRLVLLTVARLVETVEDRTLVLFDEPEAHLHPPLLGSFIRALSELLIQRNGVAVVATHSPVVLQELPKSCVLILTRDGGSLKGFRPTLETFGESLGVLTHEVFGLEVKRSGHHALINSVVKELGPGVSYEDVAVRFEGQLGTEASSIVLALIAGKES